MCALEATFTILPSLDSERIFNNSEYFFLRKKLINSYDFSFREILKRKNYKLNFVNDEFL